MKGLYDGWVNGCMDGWMNAWMDGWMDAWIDGWMDEPRSVLCPVLIELRWCGAVLLTIVFPSSFLLLSQSFLILPHPSYSSLFSFFLLFLPPQVALREAHLHERIHDGIHLQ